MNNTFDTPRLLLKPRTMDDLENCIKMDIHPLVTHYIPGIWDGSTKHITFLKELARTRKNCDIVCNSCMHIRSHFPWLHCSWIIRLYLF